MASLPQLYLSGTYQDKDCPLSLIEYKDFVIDNYINLIDYTDFIPYNREREFEEITYIKSGITSSGLPPAYYGTGLYRRDNSNTFPVKDNYDITYFPASSFLITDVVSPYMEKWPLFYEHRLQYDLYSDTVNPDKYIKIRKNGKTLLDDKKYILEYGNNTLDASGTTVTVDSNDVMWSRVKPNGKYFRCRVLLPYDNIYSDYYDIEYDAYLKGIYNRRRELIDRNPIFDEGFNYNITTSGITIVDTGSGLLYDNLESSGNLYIQKNYKSRIFFKPNDTPLITSGTSNWYLTLNPGKFIQLSGIFSNSDRVYDIQKSSGQILMSGEQPLLYNQNVLKTSKFPIYVNTSGYPTYTVTEGLDLYINDEKMDNSDFQSFDKEKGFIKIKKDLLSSDKLKLMYRVNSKENFRINNLDLNPKNFDKFKLLNDGVSLSIVPSGSFPSGLTFYRTLLNQSSNYTKITTTGYSASETFNAYASGAFGSGAILIGDINYKSSPSDIITSMDSRRLGGGLKSNKNAKEDSWYYDKGKWDGDILQSNSAVVIQIPSGIQNYFANYFKNNGSFTKENYNEQILLATGHATILEDLGFENLQKYDSIKEANKYITDSIERYLPVGTEYIIVDENFNLWDIMV